MKQKRIKNKPKNWIFSSCEINELKGSLFRSENGNLGDILGTSICLFFFIAIFIVSVHFARILDVKRTIDAKARQYLLILEERGELSASDLQSLNDDFVNMGFSDFSITFNDTNVKKEYGQKVSIKILVTSNAEELGISRIFKLFADDISFASKLESISKCGT